MDKVPNFQSLAPIVEQSPESANLLTELLADEIQREMLAAWQAGSTISAEHWLDRYPAVKAKPEMAVLIIYEELCLREERGENLDSTEFYARFPQFREALSVVFSGHRLMDSDVAKFPQAGEDLGEFRLLRELGRGGAGRVFLATQPLLSDRTLVVKLTPRLGDEHLSLARLQHTHIVPLFLVQEFPENNLRALCMPFLGGASWSTILQSLSSSPTTHRSGRGIVQALESAQRSLGFGSTPDGPAIAFLAQATYEQAICWIGACLADALHHAHQRGLLHLDIKPSNVLLAGDGQPMLLDFHLANQIDVALDGELNRVGGTPGYMSPEQHRGILALRAGKNPRSTLDPRSDIYSLGVLLYESLAGRLPPAKEQESRKILRQAYPQLGRGLTDLLHKCLADDPDSRYPDAAELAVDLRRHLSNLPLRGVTNRGYRERWQKWRRRKPHSLGAWTVSLTALTLLGCAAFLFYTDKLQAARAALEQAKQELTDGDHAIALNRLTFGLNTLRWLPGQGALKLDFQSQLIVTQRARVADALHKLVDRLRFLDGVLEAPAAKLHELDAGCHAIWAVRRQITTGTTLRSDSSRDNGAIDLLDLALLWARLMTRDSTASDFPARLSQALTIIDEAREMCGPSAALTLAEEQLTGKSISRRQFAALLSSETPKTAWEQDVVGRSLLQAGDLERARELFEHAIQLEPDAFWPNFHLMLCAYRCERFQEALHSAYVCVALSPKRAECFFNRALCLRAVGQNEAALRDLSRTLELDPSFGAAAQWRANLLAEVGR